jgi:cytochrome c oxidase cbb3-type subunit III
VASLPSGFWAGWVVVLTVGSFAVLVLLVWSTFFREGPPHEDIVWDEDLREGDAAAPIWWFWLILTMMVISVIYLLLYPGLGSFQGALKWSQAHHLAHSMEKYDEEFEPVNAEILARPAAELAQDPKAMSAARSLFSNHCAACHGPNGEGQSNRFPNLRDDDWQWGGDYEAIATSIRGGRQAAMPAWGGVFSTSEIDELTTYVQNLSLETDPTIVVSKAPVANHYVTYCAACHQANGRGNAALGAPNLADNIWLYGNSRISISHTIAVGRNGSMPAQHARLTDLQIHLLATWLTAKMPN